MAKVKGLAMAKGGKVKNRGTGVIGNGPAIKPKKGTINETLPKDHP